MFLDKKKAKERKEEVARVREEYQGIKERFIDLKNALEETLEKQEEGDEIE